MECFYFATATIIAWSAKVINIIRFPICKKTIFF